jgi:iron complex outermembrane receptor protein
MRERIRLLVRATSVLSVISADLAFGQSPSAAEDVSKDQPYRLSRVLVIGETVRAPIGGGSALEVPGQMLADRQVSSPRELTAIIPNLVLFDANGDRLPRFSVRGLRENNFGYTETAVGVYVDDVPFFDPFSRGIPLYSVELAEYQRGPQGTMFGASRPGGVLNFYTRLPGNEWHGAVRGGGGNFEAMSVSGGAGGPLIKDRMFARLDGLYSSRDGYFHNTITGTNPDSRDTLSGRAQFRWTPVDRLDLTFTVNADRFDDGALVARPLRQAGGFFDLHQDFDGYNRQSSHTYSCRAAWSGELLRVVNVVAYRDWQQDLAGDFDFGPAPLLMGFDRPELGQWSEEIRLESAAEDVKVKWSAGAFAAGRDVDRNNGYTYGPAAGMIAGATENTLSRARDLDLALFGQITWTPVKELDLTAGVRGEYDERKLGRQHLNPVMPLVLSSWDLDHEFLSLQPRAAIAYRFAPTLEGWFTFSTGYQPGGFSVSQDDPARARFGAARSEHYEVGISGHCLDERFSATVSAFWIETHDYQVYRAVSLTSFEMLNADRARSLGAEAEVRYRPVKGLELRIAGGYAHATFCSFVTPDPVGGRLVDLADRRINFVPEFTLDATVAYRHPTGLFASIGTSVVGRYWFDEFNTLKQPAYGMLHARAGWANDHFELAFIGRNLLEQRAYANALDLGPAQGFVVTPADPALFGVEVSAQF